MKLDDARALAVTLLAKHLDDSWSFRFDNAKSRFGICVYRHRQIRLSRPLTELNDEDEVRDTILHEIAHALAGSRAKHGPDWRRVCRQVGARPVRCYDADSVRKPEPAWTGFCSEGCVQWRRQRLQKRLRNGGASCPKCRKPISWTRNRPVIKD